MSIQRHSLMHTTCCSHIGQQRKINVLTVVAVSLSTWKKTIDRPIQIKIKAGPNQHRIERNRKVADVDVVVAAAEAPVAVKVVAETTNKQQIQTQIPKEKHT